MTEPKQERLFLAVGLDEEVRRGLAAHLGVALDGKPLPGRPVSPDNWHVTLRFLGWSVQEQRDRVLGYVSEHLEVSPFVVGFSGLGAFPRPARGTVLWLGIDKGEEDLAALAELCEQAARSADFPAEDRPFHPHVTLSRIRPWQDVRPLVAGVPEFPLQQSVASVVLYQSHLGRGGARYQAVERIRLPT